MAVLGRDFKELLERAEVLLLPYCAKPLWCEYRKREDCLICLKCEVGYAYKLAKELNLKAVTITNFEHLIGVMKELREKGKTFVGYCCFEFFEKRYEAFKNFGVEGVLFNVKGKTCYRRGIEEERRAYRGEFEAELELYRDTVELLRKFKKK